MIDKIEIQSLVFRDSFLDMGNPVAACFWSLRNMNSLNQEIKEAKTLITDGNNWKLIKLKTDGTFEKTQFYSGQVEFNKIYFDYDMQQVVLGLIKQAIDNATENEKVLKTVYDFVDERRYLTNITQEEKKVLADRHKFWRFLPSKVQDFFFR